MICVVKWLLLAHIKKWNDPRDAFGRKKKKTGKMVKKRSKKGGDLGSGKGGFGDDIIKKMKMWIWWKLRKIIVVSISKKLDF